MLVFISDLHFSDCTAGVQSVPAQACLGALRDIAGYARDARSEVIELVFLGDVFDLIRTTGWFGVPMAERPWGGRDAAAIERHANGLFDRIQDVNRRAFELLGSDLRTVGFDRPVRRVYVPGNHDRLCNQFPSLRRRVADVLRVEHDPGQPFSNRYWNADYRVLARHGHEWDDWNSEVGWSVGETTPLSEPSWETYMRVPIGDVVACEFASKLSVRVYQALQEVLPDDEALALAWQFKTVDDVRPMSAVLNYLLCQIHHYRRQRKAAPVLRAIKSGIARVLEELEEVPLLKDRLKTRGWMNPGTPEFSLKVLLILRRLLGMENVLRVGGWLSPWFPGDNLASAALSELRRNPCFADCGTDAAYVLYGHTHDPDQLPLDVTATQRPRAYLNTGTLRPVYQQALGRPSFVSTKAITFTLFYHPEKDPGSQARETGYTTFETWTGALLEKPVTPGEASPPAAS